MLMFQKMSQKFHSVIHLFKPRSLGLIGTMCFVALIFSCECETDNPTGSSPPASVSATNIVIDQGTRYPPHRHK